MSGQVFRDHFNRIASINGQQANGPEIRTGGNSLRVQFVSPGALAGLEGSNDKLNWLVLDDDGGTAISGLDNAFVSVRNPPKWVRPFVASDVSAVRQFESNIGVVKEAGL